MIYKKIIPTAVFIVLLALDAALINTSYNLFTHGDYLAFAGLFIVDAGVTILAAMVAVVGLRWWRYVGYAKSFNNKYQVDRITKEEFRDIFSLFIKHRPENQKDAERIIWLQKNTDLVGRKSAK